MKTSSSLDLWKGQYYCRLLAFDTMPETEDVILALGEAIAAKITDPGQLPEIMDLLPRQKMVGRSEKYFTKPLALNNIRFISSENVLRLGPGTEGAAAAYQGSEVEVTGFIISYPTAEAAFAAYESYLVHWGKEGKLDARDRSAQVEYDTGLRSYVTYRENYVLGVWDAKDPRTDFSFMKNVLVRLEKVLGARKG
jgi:hypothetical protein